MTDYTDPRTIDVDVVIGEINHAYWMRANTWTDRLSWPNVAVKALADEVLRLRDALEKTPRYVRTAWMFCENESGIGISFHGPNPHVPGDWIQPWVRVSDDIPNEEDE